MLLVPSEGDWRVIGWKGESGDEKKQLKNDVRSTEYTRLKEALPGTWGTGYTRQRGVPRQVLKGKIVMNCGR